MQNYPYPFNQKQHIFDFKVKVNFENGNISLTAPQITTPPARFGNQPTLLQSNQNIYTSPAMNNNYSIPNHPAVNNYPQHLIPPQTTLQPSTPPHYLSPNQPPYQQPLPKSSSIQLVNSSYTSLQGSEYSQLINNSMQVIQCVLCQKSFTATEFDQHLEMHRNRNNRTQISTNQKNNASHYAMTQNSFNQNNDSISSGRKANSSFQNQSYQSNQNQPMRNDSNFVPNFIQPNNHQSNSFNAGQHDSINQSSHLLGRIENPILAINAQQQANISLNSSSHHRSLSYSNSQNQSLQRINDPNHMNSIDHSPNFNQINNSNGSSFGHHGGNNLIGPSFYHNSSQESGKKAMFVKGLNQMGYIDANNSIGSQHSMSHQISPQVMVPNIGLPVQNNKSYHSYHSSQNQPSYGSHLSQQLIPQQMLNSSNQHYFSHNSSNSFRTPQNNSDPNSFSSFQQQLQHSNHSLQNNFLPGQNMMMQNFQAIESRYLNQPGGNSRQLSASQQELTPHQQMRNSRNQSRQFDDRLFSQNDISSISGESRKDLSEYSDWSDFNNSKHQEDKLQGYNSADNSIIKHMQQSKKNDFSSNKHDFAGNKHHEQSGTNPNIYIDRSSSKQKTTQQFFKKKKDHMIASTTSYYDRKFKDQDYSSSDDDEFINRTGRLSYAQRLKEKKVTDNSRPFELSNSKSGRLSKNLKQSNKSINNMSKCSDQSSLSKTKLPVNYLAREQFISTSSTSKSTHKTNLPN